MLNAVATRVRRSESDIKQAGPKQRRCFRNRIGIVVYKLTGSRTVNQHRAERESAIIDGPLADSVDLVPQPFPIEDRRKSVFYIGFWSVSGSS